MGGTALEISKLLADSFVDANSARLYMACVIEKPPATLRLTKCAACEALSMLGEAAAEFVEPIADLLEGNAEVWEVREAALRALGNMGVEGAKHWRKALELTNEKETFVASAALVALGQMGKSSEFLSEEAVDAVA